MGGRWWLAALCCWSAAAAAQDSKPRIVVSGSASDMTPPDRATIDYRVIGEGATSDEAVGAMVAKRKRIEGGLGSLGAGLEPRASEVAIAEVRSPDCRQNYNQPQLSAGPCAVLGYVATLQVTIRTAAVKQAGTAVGLIGRLGGKDPRISSFTLADVGAAQRRAIAAALADAKAKAQALAAGTGATLGRIMSVSTNGYGGVDPDELVVTGSRVAAPPAPPPPPPPIVVDLTPRPIETRGQVTVAYEIGS